MMLSRWIMTSIWFSGMSKSHRASTTSRPLFMRVAESIVILAPIYQLGCWSARSGVTSCNSSRLRVQRAPPDAVKIRRRTSSLRWPSNDWKIALCSLSTGKIRTPCRRASSCINFPAMTIGSLLAKAGKLMQDEARRHGVRIFPVDSEHSAIFQSLEGHRKEDVRRLILTASGGALWNLSREELQDVTPERALQHPNWKMGAKITIDSATLMNKGLE